MDYFFYGIQSDIKLFFVFPILCAIFRLIFVKVYQPYPSLEGHWKAVCKCFEYGFWWGMDFNAYMFLASMLLVSIPSIFFDFFRQYGLELRLFIGCAYGVILYAAFAGKMIFYYHFHDTFNYLLHMGKHAEKHNLLDVFFHQHHGVWILLGYIPYLAFMIGWEWLFQQLPSFSYPLFSSATVQYGFDVLIVLISIVGFQWVRFGGTLKHRNKPEWDTIPSIVKEDAFLARACIDDLIALKWVRRKPLAEELQQNDEELQMAVRRLLPAESCWKVDENPLKYFKHVAQGAVINKPSQIFFIVGESVPQWALDPLYSRLHVLDATKKWIQDPHTAYLKNFLPAGNISRPSIVSLMSGIYDAQLELNEMESFWKGELLTSFAGQIKKLGYRTIYWYGGNASNGNFNHFAKAQGFDEVRSATEFCGENAPRTWVGVYDHVFLEKAAELMKKIKEPTFHFVYTTSNHGPYKIPDKVLGVDTDDMLKDTEVDIREDQERRKALSTASYADHAVQKFIADMQEVYPDALFVYTGDHSALYGNFANSSLVPRDYMYRELYCTPLMMHHREITQGLFGGTTIGTHLNIMPTVLEMIAPKGFEYYSLYPSLTEGQPEGLVTPKQWLTIEELGEVASGLVEKIKESDMEGTGKFKPEDTGWQEKASNVTSLTVWIMRHSSACLRENSK